MNKLLPLILLFLITACASTEKYEKYVLSFEGKTQEELVKKFGMPGKKEKENQTEVYVYQHVDQTVRWDQIIRNGPEMEMNWFPGIVFGGDMFFGQSWCQTKFYIKNDRVISGEWRGNSCRTPE